VLLLALPFGLTLLVRGAGIGTLVAATLATSLVLLVPSFLFDSWCYGRLVLNIVSYNVLSAATGGADLYGTEPWWFYVANLLLNFNLVFLLALAFPMAVLLSSRRLASQLHLLVEMSPLFVWLVAMSLQPHKEERFMFCIYPLFAVAAAVAAAEIAGAASRLHIPSSMLHFVFV
jgi:alpha-1,2-mannosyltransferase